jgi:hypothetical protein
MENQVYEAPSLVMDQLTDLQREKILKLTFQAAEWEVDLKAIENGNLPPWLTEFLEDEEEEILKEVQDSEELITPMAARVQQGVFDMIHTFSFDSTGSVENEENNDGLFKVEKKILKLKDKLTRPFLDINASYTVIW